MEQFSSLSLDDELDLPAVRDDDPLGISKLSISDQSFRVPPQVLSKYMPHFPALPSPLRKSFSYVEATSDEMEIDEYDDERNVPNELEELPAVEDHGSPKVTFEIPAATKASTSEADDAPVIEELDEIEEEDVKEKHGEDEIQDSTAVIKALLSPTSLGVAAAAKIEGFPLPQSPRRDSLLEIHPNITESSSFQLMDVDSLKQDLRNRSKHQPIQVSINNHHHYYQNPNSYPDFQRSIVVEPHSVPQLPLHQDDRYQLPVPWSPESRPLSRGSYAFMSYLQLLLNGATISAIFVVVTAFFRTLKTDIQSSWQHRRLELAYESSRCKIQYLTNKCNLEGRPALQEQCQAWEQCMNRNNDIFFRARSTLSAKLFGEIVNSFIEPIGWKALLVILMGVVVWCFCSNFLLGFARAKSYYGDASQQRSKRSLRQLSQESYSDRDHSKTLILPSNR